MSKEKKKLNPYTKHGRLQTRVDNEEMQIVLEKALLYNGGNLSEYVREAALKYRPVTKTKAGK